MNFWIVWFVYLLLMNLNENILRLQELMGVTINENLNVGKPSSLNEEKYYIDKSQIDGEGVFAKENLRKGETIGLLHVVNKLGEKYHYTELGRKHNHSKNPTCHNVFVDNKRFLVASKDLRKGEELTTDYTLQPDLEQPKEGWKQ